MRKTILLLLLATPVFSQSVQVLVHGVARTEYAARGTKYIEALKGQEYEIRLTNPYPVRAAVALSVDGLNTIDARHTDAKSARKWVLDPFQTIVLRGWQTSDQQARRFFFTSEEKSYGQWLGKTDNLGVISAAFFRERIPWTSMSRNFNSGAGSDAPREAAAPQSQAKAAAREQSEAMKDELAATGIGRTLDHQVTMVHLDLEDAPAAVVSVRYEYHEALVALGVLPQPPPAPDALHRREKARGFTEGYCPTPPR